MSRVLEIPRLEDKGILLEKVLWQNEVRYRRLVENSPEAILVYCDHRVVFANQAAAGLLGVEKADILLNKNLEEFVHPAYWKVVFERIELAIRGEKLGKIEQKFIQQDGTVVEVEVQTGLLNFQGRSAVQVLARDITERKEQEREIRHRIEFEQLITSISTRFINLATEEIESEIAGALERLGKFVGVEHSYVVLLNENNTHIDNIIEWAEEEKLLYFGTFKNRAEKIFPFLLKKLARRGNHFVGRVEELPDEVALEKAYVASRGIQSIVAVPMLMGNVIVGSLGFDSRQADIEWTEDTLVLLKIAGEIFLSALERKRSESALRLSEHSFISAFQVSPNPMTITRLMDGRFININDSCLHMLGYSRKELIGASFLDICIGQHDRAEFVKELTLASSARNREITLCTKQGEHREGLISYEIVEINGEKHILSAFVDLTERNKLDRDMNRLERLNLIGEMAAGIGHEIRNPLTSVRGFLQVLSEKEQCCKFTEFFHIMIEELDRANSIITEYLALAKDRNIELKLQSINPIVTNLYPMLMEDANNSGTQVQLELRGVPPLLLDEKEIRHLLINLVRNANEAMGPGGVVTIRTYQEKDEVVLAIADEGSGIPQHIREKLGVPFCTTKEKGTGLGLAVCYSTAARHKAVLDFETGPEGSTFFIRFKTPEN